MHKMSCNVLFSFYNLIFVFRVKPIDHTHTFMYSIVTENIFLIPIMLIATRKVVNIENARKQKSLIFI